MPAFARSMEATLTAKRLSRYTQAAGHFGVEPLELYLWNIDLSKELYLCMNFLEVALRNKLAAFLDWKYGPDWAYSETLLRQLKSGKDQLNNAKQRQQKERGEYPAPTDAIVADLSFGFWVGLVTRKHKVPFVWRSSGNLTRIFPNEPSLQLQDASRMLEELRVLRNRIAHHEPIFHMPLASRWKDAVFLTGAICDAAEHLVRHSCSFIPVLDKGPVQRLCHLRGEGSKRSRPQD